MQRNAFERLSTLLLGAPPSRTSRSGITSQVVALLAVCSSLTATAGTPNAGAIPQSGDAIKEGDQIRFSVDAPIFGPVDGGSQRYCAPAGSRFAIDHVVVGSSTLSGSSSKGSPVTPTVEASGSKTKTTFAGADTIEQKASGTTYQGHFPTYTGEWYNPLGLLEKLRVIVSVPNRNCISQTTVATSANTLNADKPQSASASSTSTADSNSTIPTKISAGIEYAVSADDLGKYGFVRSGLTWGGLVIPYKYEFRADHSFQGAPSIAAYVGWAGWIPGVSAATVLLAGGGAVSVPASQSTAPVAATNSSSTTQAIYTIGLGELATFGGAFKAGIVFGKDYAGRNSGYKYNGATWLALTIGAGF